MYGLVRLVLIVTTSDLALGLDYRFVMAQAERIRTGGPFYAPWELVGPILPGQWADLYPPTTVALLFVPMSFLPPIVWWAVPLATIAAVVWHHRPSPAGWLVILGLFVLWPHTWTAIQLGNTVMWIAAAVAVGTVVGWPAAFVLLKPTLGPFALVGIRSRGWWLVAVGLAVVSAAMIGAWLDYLRVLANLRGFNVTYSFHDLAILLIPLVAWADAIMRSGAWSGLPRFVLANPRSVADAVDQQRGR